MRRVFTLVLALTPVVTPAASFSLGATLRAGGFGDTELHLGPTAAAPAVTGDFFPFWVDSVDHAFQLSYNASTNTATLLADWLGVFASAVTWNPAGGSPSTAPRTWTIGAGGLSVTAQNNPLINSSINISNLQISGPGLAVITLPSLTASQNGTGSSTAALNSPITFITPNGQGNWRLDGTIRFAGLSGILTTGDQLRMAFNAFASDVPEPATMLIGALGFAALGVLHHFRTRRRRRQAGLAVTVRVAKPTTSS